MYMNEQWVTGFLSGIGFVGEDGADPLKGLDGNAVHAWIDNYCHAHPLEQKLSDAACPN